MKICVPLPELGQEVPEPCPIGQRTQCGLFHLSEISRKCASDDLLDQLGGTPQSLLQAHFTHAGSDAIPRLCSLSLGLCCQGENRRDVCKTTTVFSGMENQVKRQIKINITNSPPAWGTPSRRGRTKENLIHFFGHYLAENCLDRTQVLPIFVTAQVMWPDVRKRGHRDDSRCPRFLW